MSRIDFNGDGRDDILWWHPRTGLVTNWLGQQNGGFVVNPEVGEEYWPIRRLIAIGDFNADGRSDLLWHQANGEVYMSPTYQDGSFLFGWSIGFVARVGVEWRAEGTGDFNGDGRDDVLWRHDNGAVTVWLGQSNYVFSDNGAAAVVVDEAWHVAGTGDFNGDGRDDVLWRHDNGIVTDWLGQANGSFAGNFAKVAVAVNAGWQAVATGDYNGDGRDDVLWRNVDGTITDWLGQADGTFLFNFASAAYPVDLAWHVAGSGDYNGDGRDDILWRHETGIVTDWLGQADGTFISNFANAAYAVDQAWQIQPALPGIGYWDY